MTDLVKRLRIKAGMIEMCERIAWGSDSALMREAADALEMVAPAVQGEPVTSAPVAAQHRFRHPQKSPQDWSVWQPTTISLDRPSWEIDSQGFEVEYRLLYAGPQTSEQPTFSVGTDLSDGKLSVVVMKHENNITWVIHSEVIHIAERQPDVYQLWGLLEEALHHVIISPDPVRGGFIQEIEAALAAMQEPMIGRRDMDETTNKETT